MSAVPTFAKGSNQSSWIAALLFTCCAIAAKLSTAPVDGPVRFKRVFNATEIEQVANPIQQVSDVYNYMLSAQKYGLPK